MSSTFSDLAERLATICQRITALEIAVFGYLNDPFGGAVRWCYRCERGGGLGDCLTLWPVKYLGLWIGGNTAETTLCLLPFTTGSQYSDTTGAVYHHLVDDLALPFAIDSFDLHFHSTDIWGKARGYATCTGVYHDYSVPPAIYPRALNVSRRKILKTSGTWDADFAYWDEYASTHTHGECAILEMKLNVTAADFLDNRVSGMPVHAIDSHLDGWRNYPCCWYTILLAYIWQSLFKFDGGLAWYDWKAPLSGLTWHTRTDEGGHELAFLTDETPLTQIEDKITALGG
jgi:hypothetical protein